MSQHACSSRHPRFDCLSMAKHLRSKAIQQQPTSTHLATSSWPLSEVMRMSSGGSGRPLRRVGRGGRRLGTPWSEMQRIGAWPAACQTAEQHQHMPASLLSAQPTPFLPACTQPLTRAPTCCPTSWSYGSRRCLPGSAGRPAGVEAEGRQRWVQGRVGGKRARRGDGRHLHTPSRHHTTSPCVLSLRLRLKAALTAMGDLRSSMDPRAPVPATFSRERRM